MIENGVSDEKVLEAIPAEGGPMTAVAKALYGDGFSYSQWLSVQARLAKLKEKGRATFTKVRGVRVWTPVAPPPVKKPGIPKAHRLAPEVFAVIPDSGATQGEMRKLLPHLDTNDIRNTLTHLEVKGKVNSFHMTDGHVVWHRSDAPQPVETANTEELPPEPEPKPVVEEVVVNDPPIVEEPTVTVEVEIPVGHVHGAAFQVGDEIQITSGRVGTINVVNVHKHEIRYGMMGGDRMYRLDEIRPAPKFRLGAKVQIAAIAELVGEIIHRNGDRLLVSVEVHESHLTAVK